MFVYHVYESVIDPCLHKADHCCLSLSRSMAPCSCCQLCWSLLLRDSISPWTTEKGQVTFDWPTAHVHSYNTRSSTSRNFYIQKSSLEIQKKSFSRIGAKLWNEIPTKLRDLPKRTFSKIIRNLLLALLESEDSFVDLQIMISKLKMHDG